ncbi:MAG: hypothetical protein KBT21_10010 [Treponema sp.]|nr:hypothetical protein [Candidatus Treponema merdequi]
MFMILDEYAVEKIEDCPPCSLFEFFKAECFFEELDVVVAFKMCKVDFDELVYYLG